MRGQDEMRSDGYCCRFSVRGKGIKSCGPWKSSHLRGMLSMVLGEKEGIHSQQLMKYLSTLCSAWDDFKDQTKNTHFMP
jgi:hypothetical protein